MIFCAVNLKKTGLCEILLSERGREAVSWKNGEEGRRRRRRRRRSEGKYEENKIESIF